jgi:hypothetical protein
LEKAVIIQGVKRTTKYEKRAERRNKKRRESVEKEEGGMNRRGMKEKRKMS